MSYHDFLLYNPLQNTFILRIFYSNLIPRHSYKRSLPEILNVAFCEMISEEPTQDKRCEGYGRRSSSKF